VVYIIRKNGVEKRHVRNNSSLTPFSLNLKIIFPDSVLVTIVAFFITISVCFGTFEMIFNLFSKFEFEAFFFAILATIYSIFFVHRIYFYIPPDIAREYELNRIFHDSHLENKVLDETARLIRMQQYEEFSKESKRSTDDLENKVLDETARLIRMQQYEEAIEYVNKYQNFNNERQIERRYKDSKDICIEDNAGAFLYYDVGNAYDEINNSTKNALEAFNMALYFSNNPIQLSLILNNRAIVLGKVMSIGKAKNDIAIACKLCSYLDCVIKSCHDNWVNPDSYTENVVNYIFCQSIQHGVSISEIEAFTFDNGNNISRKTDYYEAKSNFEGAMSFLSY